MSAQLGSWLHIASVICTTVLPSIGGLLVAPAVEAADGNRVRHHPSRKAVADTLHLRSKYGLVEGF